MKIRFLLLLVSVFVASKSFAQDGILFTFSAGSKSLETNKMIYKSAAGLSYEVCQVQFFISKVSLEFSKRDCEILNSFHYVDFDIPNTLKWFPSPNFSLKDADSLIFTFGLDSVDNCSFRFKNPPENYMFWPDYLGGGYHYMKTNIRYIDSCGYYNTFNCHLGRGQVYDSDNEPISFIENYFEIRIPIKTAFFNNQTFAVINLDIPTIFDYPHQINFSDYSGIMNNQEAMKLFLENIKYAFKK